MQQLLQTLYSTVHYRFSQRLIDAYVKNRVCFTNSKHESVTVKLAGAEDFYQLAKTIDKFRDGSRLTERTQRGDVCVVAYKHGALAHFRWAALTPIPAWGDYTVHLEPHEAYTFDSYTIPAFRRQGIGSKARIFLMQYLAERGICYTYHDSRVDNVYTQTWMKRVLEGSSRILGQITVATRLGWTRCTFTAETADTRPLIARLFLVPPQKVQIKPIFIPS